MGKKYLSTRKIEDLSSSQRLKLEREVSSYLRDNIYRHSFNGFTLFYYRGIYSDKNGIVYPILNSRNAIYTKDPEWEEGLRKIGEKFRVVVQLPDEIYIK